MTLPDWIGLEAMGMGVEMGLAVVAYVAMSGAPPELTPIIGVVAATI
jgi:hypothetical protein